MGPISKKVIDGLQKAKNRKIINFSEIKAANAYAQDLDKTVVSKDNLSKHDPFHAVYIYAQNKVSVLVEQLSEFPALSKLTDSLSKADDIYLPSYPPKSPHTQSYFSCWGFFDLCTGIKKESFGTVILDLLKYLKSDPGLIKTVECMQNSRMGIFIHKGQSDRYVILEELVTGKEIKAYESFMKYGKNKHFWNEYIFEGFVNYQADMIMLAGFPDIPLSLPHSEASQRERGEI